jgi:5'-nucleotidase
VVVAPAENCSGVARLATYAVPVELEWISSVAGIEHYACSGTPVDCVRAALLGDVAPQARLVVSGINHGPNLGDDTLNSGTVAAAGEGALLGGCGLAVSQQSYDGHFHILDAFDQTTPVYDVTAEIAALFVSEILATPGPERVFLNVNVPATLAEPRVELTHLGRRRYGRGSVAPVDRGGKRGYRTYGERNGPPPDFDAAPGTDFAALLARRVSVTTVSYDWGDPQAGAAATEWAAAIAARVEGQIDRLVSDLAPPA